MNDTQKSETVTVETRQEETKKSSNILRESGWYVLWRSGDWYVIDYFSPTYTTNIGYFPREAAAIAVFEQVKEQIPAEAQRIALNHALEHFPEIFRTHIPCEMNF